MSSYKISLQESLLNSISKLIKLNSLMAFTLKTLRVRSAYYQNYINWPNLLNINKNASYRQVRDTYRAYEDKREFKIEVFLNFPQTQEVTWPGLDHAPEIYIRYISDLRIPQGFLNPKTSQFHVWEEIRLSRTILLIDYRILFPKKGNFEDNISQLK